MRIKMWGVRGSIPTPGPSTVEFGGNTSCYEVRAGDTLIILDGGTGLRLLGQELLKQMPFEAWMFFSHVHWDHIQGFPFFTPAFVRGNKIHLHGGINVSRTLEETLAGQMDYPSFPVHLTEMGASMTFRDLYEGEVITVGSEERRDDHERAREPPERRVRLPRGLRRGSRSCTSPTRSTTRSSTPS
jgi:phosphoribosyl 1,2-cyclic phosphodiesterase